MNLLIRSQNRKRIMKNPNLTVYKRDETFDEMLGLHKTDYDKDKKYHIKGDGNTLAVYATEQRVIEILDEIWNQMLNDDKDIFYEMPIE